MQARCFAVTLGFMKKPRARTVSRALDRQAKKLTADRERLARLEPGGSATLPIEIESASQLTLRSESYLCLRCSGPVRYVDDCVVEIAGDLRRAATLECKQCATRRVLWFRIAVARPN